MACKLCARVRAHLWEKTDAWERAHTSETGPWSDDPALSLELVERAYAVQETDPLDAHELMLDAAEAGSAWAMNVVALRYWTGTVVEADLGWAEEYYRRAMETGSWMAAIHLARLLAEQGRHDDCETMLRDCVSRDFVPAYFWLAFLRYQRQKSRKVRREIKPLLVRAAEAWHPAAHAHLGIWMVIGRFGLLDIPAGFMWMSRWVARPEADLAFLCDRNATDTRARA